MQLNGLLEGIRYNTDPPRQRLFENNLLLYEERLDAPWVIPVLEQRDGAVLAGGFYVQRTAGLALESR